MERPDGSVGLLMRMPHLQTQGAYSIDLNHACLLSYQPSHFGQSATTTAHGSAGALVAYAAAAAGSNATGSSATDDNAADDTARGLLSAEPMIIQEMGIQGMLPEAAGQTSQQPQRRGEIKWHMAVQSTVRRQLVPRPVQQQQQQGPPQQGQPDGSQSGSAGTAATAAVSAADGTLAYDRVVVSVEPCLCLPLLPVITAQELTLLAELADSGMVAAPDPCNIQQASHS